MPVSHRNFVERIAMDCFAKDTKVNFSTSLKRKVINDFVTVDLAGLKKGNAILTLKAETANVSLYFSLVCTVLVCTLSAIGFVCWTGSSVGLSNDSVSDWIGNEEREMSFQWGELLTRASFSRTVFSVHFLQKTGNR
jgi:hypothetical protein